ncbi:MAG: metal-dependent hydrolase, partial [Archaeoglobi archaeon]|nr:metal-dependent hydrolase [Candidatus Mnemosynella sp.]
MRKSYWGIFSYEIISRTTPHRGWTHSLIGAGIFTLIFAILLLIFESNPIYAIAFFLGYVAHLLS